MPACQKWQPARSASLPEVPINESPWGRCLQGAVDAPRWVVVRCCCRRSTGGSFLTNRAETHGQLVSSPFLSRISLRSSRLVQILNMSPPRPASLYFCVFLQNKILGWQALAGLPDWQAWQAARPGRLAGWHFWQAGTSGKSAKTEKI